MQTLKTMKWGDEKAEYVKQHKSSNKRKRVELDTNLIYSVGNEVHFTGSIDTTTIELIIKEITHIIHEHINGDNKNEKLTITYIVDTPGGSVSAVLKFVDFIRLIKSKYNFIEFVSVITGLVASAGTIMCIVADKRIMTKNSHAMIHELSAGRAGNITHIISHTKFLSKLHDNLMEIYLSKIKKTKEQLTELLKDETWFTAQEYLEKGFIEEIK